MLAAAAGMVLFAVAAPAAPALAWHYDAECDDLGLFVTGTITFPAGSAPFTVFLEGRVGEDPWQQVMLSSDTITPTPGQTSASFSLLSAGTVFYDEIRVANSRTNEVSQTFPPCLPPE